MVSNIILLGMRLYIPSKNKSINRKDRFWFKKTCADPIRTKEEAFIEWKSVPTPVNDLLRKKARNRCHALLKQQQFLHDQKLQRKVLDYSKGSTNCWPFAKTMKNTETSTIPHSVKDGQAHSVEKANILVEIFSKNSSLSASDQPLPFTPRASCTMSEVHIRTMDVKRVLAKLDIKKSSRPEGRYVFLKYVLRHWPKGFAICSTLRLNRVNFLHVGKLQTFSQFPKKATPRTQEIMDP